MNTSELQFRVLTAEDSNVIIPLALKLNKEYTSERLRGYFKEMFQFKNYTCFGIFFNTQLVGLSSGWTTIKLYSGKQLEIDNIIIEPNYQSKGYGTFLEEKIYNWCKQRDYNSIELNADITNSRSHKFYFNQGYQIIGFHFEKSLK